LISTLPEVSAQEPELFAQRKHQIKTHGKDAVQWLVDNLRMNHPAEGKQIQQQLSTWQQKLRLIVDSIVNGPDAEVAMEHERQKSPELETVLEMSAEFLESSQTEEPCIKQKPGNEIHFEHHSEDEVEIDDIAGDEDEDEDEAFLEEEEDQITDLASEVASTSDVEHLSPSKHVRTASHDSLSFSPIFRRAFQTSEDDSESELSRSFHLEECSTMETPRKSGGKQFTHPDLFKTPSRLSDTPSQITPKSSQKSVMHNLFKTPTDTFPDIFSNWSESGHIRYRSMHSDNSDLDMSLNKRLLKEMEDEAWTSFDEFNLEDSVLLEQPSARRASSQTSATDIETSFSVLAESRLETLKLMKLSVYNLHVALTNCSDPAEKWSLKKDLSSAQQRLGSYSYSEVQKMLGHANSSSVDDSMYSQNELDWKQELGELCLVAARWKSAQVRELREEGDDGNSSKPQSLQELVNQTQELSFRAVVWKFEEFSKLEASLQADVKNRLAAKEKSPLEISLINTRMELEEMSSDAARFASQRIHQLENQMGAHTQQNEQTATVKLHKVKDIYGQLCAIATKHQSQQLKICENELAKAELDDSIWQNHVDEHRSDLQHFSEEATRLLDRKVDVLKELLGENLSVEVGHRLKRELKATLRDLAYCSCEVLILKHCRVDEEKTSCSDLLSLRAEINNMHLKFGLLHQNWMHEMQQEEEYGVTNLDIEFFKIVISQLRKILNSQKLAKFVQGSQDDFEAQCVAEALGQEKDRYDHMLRMKIDIAAERDLEKRMAGWALEELELAQNNQRLVEKRHRQAELQNEISHAEAYDGQIKQLKFLDNLASNLRARNQQLKQESRRRAKSRRDSTLRRRSGTTLNLSSTPEAVQVKMPAYEKDHQLAALQVQREKKMKEYEHQMRENQRKIQVHADLKIMKAGCEMWRLPRQSGALARRTFVKLDDSQPHYNFGIRWASKRKGGKAFFPLLKTSEVYIGLDHGGFLRKGAEKALKPVPDCNRDLAFTVVNSNSTLDLVCTDEQQFYTWTKTLSYILFQSK